MPLSGYPGRLESFSRVVSRCTSYILLQLLSYYWCCLDEWNIFFLYIRGSADRNTACCCTFINRVGQNIEMLVSGTHHSRNISTIQGFDQALSQRYCTC